MKLVVAGIILLTGIMIHRYLDIPLPSEMEDKWKIRIIDAILRTYRNLGKLLCAVGLIKPFSSLDRTLADSAVNILTTGLPWRQNNDPALKIRDIFTDKNKIRFRIYEPSSTLHQDNRPVLVYVHGGGWSVLSIDSYDALTRKLARDSGVVVVSVNYRQSPQFPYPGPHDDCVETMNYLRESATELKIDPNRIAIGGDSAGGNLAASVSLHLREKIKLQLLLVPVLQLFTFNTTSMIENQKYFASTTNNLGQLAFWMNYLNESYEYAPFMLENQHTSADMKQSKFADYVDQNKWMIRHHIRDESLKTNSLEQQNSFGKSDMPKSFTEKLKNPYIAPLMADEDMLRGLPRAYVMTAGYDIIRDDGIMYSERLNQANVPVHLMNHASAFHISLMFSEGPLALQTGKRIIQDIVSYLQLHL